MCGQRVHAHSRLISGVSSSITRKNHDITTSPSSPSSPSNVILAHRPLSTRPPALRASGTLGVITRTPFVAEAGYRSRLELCSRRRFNGGLRRRPPVSTARAIVRARRVFTTAGICLTCIEIGKRAHHGRRGESRSQCTSSALPRRSFFGSSFFAPGGSFLGQCWLTKDRHLDNI